MFVENSGTTVRFLTAVLGLHGGRYRLHGIDRMHQRPIGPLLDALLELNVGIEAESPGGCPPVVIDGQRVVSGESQLSGTVSSQYLSGLMMAAPLAENGLKIRLKDELVSQPYVEMTRSVMAAFGVESELNLEAGPVKFRVDAGRHYQAAHYLIEPDASAASYFFAAAAICDGTVTIKGLDRRSLQGDVAFVECLAAMGCGVVWGDNQISIRGRARHGIDVDMADISDTVQTLAAVSLFVEGTTRIRGVAHNRVKETDRIGDLAVELRKLGAVVEEHEDGLTIEPQPLRAATIETYNDHRMAMSLSLVGLRQPGVVILNPACTGKTYPRFFDDLAKLRTA